MEVKFIRMDECTCKFRYQNQPYQRSTNTTSTADQKQEKNYNEIRVDEIDTDLTYLQVRSKNPKTCHVNKNVKIEVDQEAFRLESNCIYLMCRRWQQRDPTLEVATIEDGCACRKDEYV